MFKQGYAKVVIFLIAFFVSNAFPHAKLFAWEKTKQKVFATCFSNFDNLYFNNSSRTFFTVGKDTEIGHSFNLADKRGYSWKQYPIGPRMEKKPVCIPETTIFLFERGATPTFCTHYFHFLEHLLGIWNFGGEENRKSVGLFVLASNGIDPVENWKGANDITYHLIKALFPNAEIRIWESFVEQTQGKILCFEKAITSDRSMEIFKKEPYFTDRMLGGYFQLLSKNSLDRLAAHVWKYCGVEIAPFSKTRVTYVRRAIVRRLKADCEEELINRIKKLPNVELCVVDFASIPFSEQVNIVANTDVLLGVHGNGLSHTLFLPSGASLIEFFPENTFQVEYRIFAKRLGFDYWGWVPPNGWISDQTVERIGCHGNPRVDELSTNVDAIIQVLEWISSH